LHLYEVDLAVGSGAFLRWWRDEERWLYHKNIIRCKKNNIMQNLHLGANTRKLSLCFRVFWRNETLNCFLNYIPNIWRDFIFILPSYELYWSLARLLLAGSSTKYSASGCVPKKVAYCLARNKIETGINRKGMTLFLVSRIFAL